MTEHSIGLKKPVLSPRFDVEDIQRLREYNSLRHWGMSHADIVAETYEATADIIEQFVKSGHAHFVNIE
ncbi:MAG: hypothetical protein IKQ61_00945 [Spirochaetales bacterium]|nr:hypothetical protein [Spirochaetales bacterium]